MLTQNLVLFGIPEDGESGVTGNTKPYSRGGSGFPVSTISFRLYKGLLVKVKHPAT